jgi:hypothetical protein
MKSSQFAPYMTRKLVVLQPTTGARFPSVLCDGWEPVMS